MNYQELENLTFKGTYGRDEFRREQVAEKAIQLLVSAIDVSPMVIDGDWGTGKTEFCHKLINKFKEEHKGYRLLYVDSFQADHADNPLVTVLAGVMSLLPEGSAKTKLLQKAMPVVRFAATTAGKAVVSHLLKQNADELAEGLEARIQEAADQAIDASVKTLLKEHEEAKKNLQALQAALAKIAENEPIVIFVDELDRCRPDFAVQMLEVIKHTFNVDGVQFVLVTNKRQLKAAINHRYGDQVDAQRYLDKFLKFGFRLPDFVPGLGGYDDGRLLASMEYFNNLVSRSEFLKDTHLADPGNRISDFCRSLIKENGSSLREVETFVRYLEIYHKIGGGLRRNFIWGYQLLRIFGVFIYCFEPEVARSVEVGKADANRLAGILGVDGLPDHNSEFFQRSDLQSFAVFVAQASFINSSKYFPPKDQLEATRYWEGDRNAYFRGDYVRLSHMHDPMREAIRCLQLGSA